jgi:hypothetical protein
MDNACDRYTLRSGGGSKDLRCRPAPKTGEWNERLLYDLVLPRVKMSGVSAVQVVPTTGHQQEPRPDLSQ